MNDGAILPWRAVYLDCGIAEHRPVSSALLTNRLIRAIGQNRWHNDLFSHPNNDYYGLVLLSFFNVLSRLLVSRVNENDNEMIKCIWRFAVWEIDLESPERLALGQSRPNTAAVLIRKQKRLQKNRLKNHCERLLLPPLLLEKCGSGRSMFTLTM